MNTILTYVIGLTIFVCGAQMSAQCDSAAQVIDSASMSYPMLTDSTHDSTAGVSGDRIVPKYRYWYASDSSKIRLEFQEFAKNRKWLYLANWCEGRNNNWNSSNGLPTSTWSVADMNAYSYTRPFSMTGGDTLQFYRSIWWVDRLNNAVLADRYVNSNGFFYSVELFNTSTGNRIALLDTTRFGTTTTSRKPCIQSWYPMLSRVRYIAPSTMATATVAIRVNTYTSGSNPNPIVRQDILDFAQSANHLENSTWQAWNAKVEDNLDCSTTTSCAFTCSASSGSMTVTITNTNDLDRITVYSVHGELINNTTIPATSPYTVTLTSGLYIVVGINDDAVTCTRKITVQ